MIQFPQTQIGIFNAKKKPDYCLENIGKHVRLMIKVNPKINATGTLKKKIIIYDYIRK